MNIDWQTIFYIISSITMVVFLGIVVALILIIRKMKIAAEKAAAGATAIRSLAKVSVLRMLLKIIR